jgi:hypothetical protein
MYLIFAEAPKNIRFVTNDNPSVIEGTKGQNITLSCVVDSGIPREMLRIKRNDSEVARDNSYLKMSVKRAQTAFKRYHLLASINASVCEYLSF